MKTIVLLAKTGESVETLNAYLRQYFRVQLAMGDVGSMYAMVRAAQPDLIVIALDGFLHGDRSLLTELQRGFHQTPVILLGTPQQQLPFASFCIGGQFETLPSLIAEEILLRAICERIGLDAEAVQKESAAGSKKAVLVVDDNAATLRSLKAMLEERYNVTLANSGMKALTSIGKSRPDVILLDYEMPVCDGRQTLQMIRADEELRDIPVIFLTSVNDKEHIQAVIQLLPAGYLLKPAVPERLIEAIEKALAQNRK